MDKKKNTTCRICLRFGSKVKKNCKSLFEIHNSSIILDHITLIANIKIDADDGLPSKICGECLTELDTAINFKHKCERSNKLLHSINKCDVKESNISPNTRLSIPIKLVKKEDASEDDFQYEVEDLDNDEVDSDIKEELDHYEDDFQYEVEYFNDEIDSDIKEELDHTIIESTTNLTSVDNLVSKSDITEESNVILAKTESNEPVPKKSKAIDLKLICDDCGGSFRTKCKLRVHWKKVHMLERLICQFCKRTFKCFISYHKHLKNRPKNCIIASKMRIEGTGKSRVYHCSDCNFHTKKADGLELHLNIHTGNRQFPCKDCSKAFTQPSSLDSHRERVHKIYKKEITCQYCGAFVQGRDKIRRHLARHTRTPIQCDICKKMFKSKVILINHLKIHSGVKSYKCEKCSAAFYTSSQLVTHKRVTHANKRTYHICDICGFKTVKKATMQHHKLMHNTSEFACGDCGRFYPDAEELASHRKRHTKEKSVCFECNKTFFNERNLKRHKIETHMHQKRSQKKTITVLKYDADSDFDEK